MAELEIAGRCKPGSRLFGALPRQFLGADRFDINAQPFSHARIALREGRVLPVGFDPEVREGSGEERPARDVLPVKNKTVLVEHRHDIERHVAEVHDPSPGGERQHHRQVQLRVDPQQGEKRQNLPKMITSES